VTDLLASLCGEPWCYTPAEAGRLTYYQIGRILYAEHDDKGQLIIRPKTEALSSAERFTRAWLKRGLPRWRIAELWQDHLRQAAEAEQARKAKRKGRKK
jgi:hypothetical protein